MTESPIEPKNQDNKKAVGVEVGGEGVGKNLKKEGGWSYAPKSDSELQRYE